MSRLLVRIWVALAFVVAVQSHTLDWIRTSSHAAHKAWNAWGWIWQPDNLVTVADRDNPVTFASRPAIFGAEVKQPLLGYVIPLSFFTKPCANDTTFPVHEDDNMGCPQLCLHGPHAPGRSEPWIALVQRGTCSFAAKAREAQRLGAKAIVIGGGDPAVTGQPDTLISMMDPGGNDDIELVSTYILWSDYVVLHGLIEASDTLHSGLRTVSLVIQPETPGGWLSPTLTFITILLLPSFLTFTTLLIHRFRMVRAARRERAPEDIVNSLPWRVWTGNGWEKHEGTVPGQDHPCTTPANPPDTADIETGLLGHAAPSASNDVHPSSSGAAAHGRDNSDDEPEWAKKQYECAICLSEFAIGDRVRVLPCSHIFHMDEVDGWLINNKKLCPICKADVTQAPGSAPPSSEAHSEDDATNAADDTEQTPLLPRVRPGASDNAS